MDNKNTDMLLALVAKTSLSEEEKKGYSQFIISSNEKSRRELGEVLRDKPELLTQLVENYKKKKAVADADDKDAYKKLVEEEIKQLEELAGKE
jgi:hypothetical protein